jgi:hypothetical protein
MRYNGKTVNRLPDEFYQCACTDRDENYTFAEVCDTWNCPNCGDPITIYAESESANDKGVFYRKRAKHIEKGDLVKPAGFDVDKSFEVLGISEAKDGKLALGLKGYTRISYHPEEWLTLRVGGW